jgi:DNA-binding LytR/AlgR family response regulator
MKTLIVDDEALARKLLTDYVSKIPELELVGVCEDAIEASAFLKKNQVDLLLLDIEMPGLTGVELLKSLKDQPITIFTTAYEQYALKGYELHVIDYLLKPFPFDRFFGAISKALDYFNLQSRPSQEEPKKDYFFVKADYKVQKILYDEMLYAEGMREYVRIHTTSRRITVRQSMNRLEESLPDNFIRIHRSHIINIDKLESISPHSATVAGQELPVSKSYRDALQARVERDQLF